MDANMVMDKKFTDAVIAKVDFSEYEDEAALQKRYGDAVRAAIRETDRKMHTVKTA